MLPRADTSLPPRTRQKSDCVKREKLQVHIPQCCTPLFPPILHTHARTHTVLKGMRVRTHKPLVGDRKKRRKRGRRSRARRRSVFTVIMLLFLCHKMGHGKKKKSPKLYRQCEHQCVIPQQAPNNEPCRFYGFPPQMFLSCMLTHNARIFCWGHAQGSVKQSRLGFNSGTHFVLIEL